MVIHANMSAMITAPDDASKAERVYRDLREAIVSLKLRPGLRIDRNALAGRLGVSRQPVAEALSRLAGERLVDVEPQKGTFVARIRMREVAEAAFVRRALEVAMAREIAADIDAMTLKRLEKSLGLQAAALKSRDWATFYALDVSFHALLFERLGMRGVAAAVEASRAQLERARRSLLPEAGRGARTLREHRQLVTALRSHDAGAAAEAMRAHLDGVVAEMGTFVAARPDLFED